VAEEKNMDPEAWVDRYGDYLYRYAFLRLGDHAAAEDVVQETFLAGLSSRSKYSGRSSEKTWLTGILKHKIGDQIRKRIREPIPTDIPALEEQLFNEKGRWKIKLPRWPANPRALLKRKEFRDILAFCLSLLPPRSAAVFSLREMDGLETEEICNNLSISPTNCMVILHRVRLRLRNCLELRWFAPNAKGKS